MQPEEIIEQKEWHQLSAEERSILAPLAADEQEFNLLKKMLLVADEAGSDVPTIAPAVQKQLSRSVRQKGADRKMWYYAAATVALVVVAGWFYLRTRVNDNNKIARVNPIINKVISKDSAPSKERVAPEKEIASPDSAKPIRKDKSAPVKQIPVITIPNHADDVAYVHTSTLLKDDTELMSLITEVY